MLLMMLILIISIILGWMYVDATFNIDKSKGDFSKTTIDTKLITRKINWMNKFSNFKDSFFYYPTEEVSLEFNSFNTTKTDKREYSIFSLNFNTKKYDFECIRISLDSKNVIYSFFKSEFNVRIDLIVDDLTNKNYIQSETRKCLFKKSF